MSRNKYEESADRAYSKDPTLINKEAKVQTSQNTSDCSSSEWFSDVFEK